MSRTPASSATAPSPAAPNSAHQPAACKEALAATTPARSVKTDNVTSAIGEATRPDEQDACSRSKQPSCRAVPCASVTARVTHVRRDRFVVAAGRSRPSCSRYVIRILLVEDDLHIARAMARLLSHHFAIVDVLDDAETALLRVDVDEVDVVVTDYHLGHGRMTGIALAGAISARAPEIPVILVSGSLDDRVEALAKAAGIRATLPKPFSPAELVSAIDAAVAARDGGRRRDPGDAPDVVAIGRTRTEQAG